MISDNAFMDVGIDSIAFYTSKFYVDLKDLAKVRGVDPNKYVKGLLTREMRIPEIGEDIVTMCIKAGQYALMKGEISPKNIDALFIGTETTTYAAKSIANTVAEVLGISRNTLTQDTQNACASGTIAVLNAIGLVNTGIINKALVIAADISSYKIKSPGEPTQGMAAVALVISKQPRVAKFSKNFGMMSSNVNDFYRLPGEKYPDVVGKYSIDSYIKLQEGAFDDFQTKNPFIIPNYYIFHSPFAKLPLKNIQNLLKNRWEKISKSFLENHFSPDIHSEFDDEYIEAIVKPVIDSLFENRQINDVEYTKHMIMGNLKRKVLPMLHVPMHVGNMYSASVWAQMSYFLENLAMSLNTLYFGSYGSGATCISGMIKVMPGFEAIVKSSIRIKFP